MITVLTVVSVHLVTYNGYVEWATFRAELPRAEHDTLKSEIGITYEACMRRGGDCNITLWLPGQGRCPSNVSAAFYVTLPLPLRTC
jgi:hypothetical protein